jgi:hypothetical protein
MKPGLALEAIGVAGAVMAGVATGEGAGLAASLADCAPAAATPIVIAVKQPKSKDFILTLHSFSRAPIYRRTAK